MEELGYKGRDVEVVPLSQEDYLVVACDSCGGIGSKALDVIKVSWYITGRFTTRVALAEVMSTGAWPKAITIAVSNELTPTGEGILEGVKDELVSNGFEIPMAISTEKNMKTQQTGLGVSVVGVADRKQLRIGTSQRGDGVYCLGCPKVGPEVSDPEDPEIIQVSHIQDLLCIEGVHDILPVGSRGVRIEAEQLAASVNTELILEDTSTIDLAKSAGPSTCLIFTAASECVIDGFGALPLNKIGTFF